MFAKIQQNFDSLKRMQINLIKRGKDFQRKGFLKGNPQSGATEMFVNFLSLFSLQNSRGFHQSGNQSRRSDFWPFLQLSDSQQLMFSMLSNNARTPCFHPLEALHLTFGNKVSGHWKQAFRWLNGGQNTIRCPPKYHPLPFKPSSEAFQPIADEPDCKITLSDFFNTLYIKRAGGGHISQQNCVTLHP